MSKDKAGKKDKRKRLDLFEMMLNQSEIFRDMVEHFQSVWVPRAPSVASETGVSARSPKKQAEAAPAASPAKKRSARKTAASTKSVPAAARPSARKSPAKARGKTASSQAKPLAKSRKAAGKATATGRTASKK